MLGKEPPTYRVRCSALGQLMTPGRSKSNTLSETAKSMLVLWYKEQLYGRKKELQSKYLTKGNTVENESIAYVNKIYGISWQKNEQTYSNDYLQGTPDIVADLIIDIKNSWDFSTFPLFSKNIPTKDYHWQVQGYMALTGKTKAAVIYTLMDLPDEQIEQEYKHSGGSGLLSASFKASYKYQNISDNLKVKRYDFDYDPSMVEQIIAKVDEARQFIQSLRY